MASSIILIHNHPSGNRNPSEADRRRTAKLNEAGKYLDIPILDHIIFTESGYFSFADEGFLQEGKPSFKLFPFFHHYSGNYSSLLITLIP